MTFEEWFESLERSETEKLAYSLVMALNAERSSIWLAPTARALVGTLISAVASIALSQWYIIGLLIGLILLEATASKVYVLGELDEGLEESFITQLYAMAYWVERHNVDKMRFLRYATMAYMWVVAVVLGIHLIAF